MPGMTSGEITFDFWIAHLNGIDTRGMYALLLQNRQFLQERTDRSAEDEETLREVNDAIAEINRTGLR